jgi:arabinofuranosyltransferase
MPLIVAAIFGYGLQRYWFLGDDSYISFRYAAHLVDGQGLVWNPGEAVEGYTNFLWVILMAAGMWVGIPPEYLSNIIGVASGVAVIALVVRWSAQELDGGWAHPFAWIAATLLVSTRSFTAWCTGGLATMFFAALILGALSAFIWERDRRIMPWRSALLLALASLTRPEGALFTGLIGLFFVYDLWFKRRRTKEFATWVAIWWVMVGAHLVFRWLTYGDLVPNTFHAKVNRLWWDQGFKYLGLFIEDYRLLWWGWLALVPPLFRRAYRDWLLTVCVAAHVLYLGSIGGDRFEFRFIVFVLPIYMLLAGEGLLWLAQRKKVPLRVGLIGALTAAVAICTAEVSGSRETENSMRHFVAGVYNMRAYANRRVREGSFLKELVDAGKLPKDLRICTGGAGALPYYSELWTLDYYGLNDARVASRDVKDHESFQRIGHEHEAHPRYIVKRNVQMVDGIGRIVWKKGDHPRKALQMAKSRAKYFNKARKVVYKPRCRYVDDRFLIYLSPLSDSKHEQVFGHLEACKGNWPQPSDDKAQTNDG